MTPAQRQAALRLADHLDSFHVRSEDKQAAALLRELARAPQGEPVAWLWQHGETGRTRIVMPDQITDCDAGWQRIGPLYLHPTPRPLTDEQIMAAIKSISFNEMTAFNIARAVERARGEA